MSLSQLGYHKSPLVSVVIPTRNRRESLIRCISSVYKSAYPSFELIVVDDASDFKVEEALKKHVIQTKVIRNEVRRFLAYSRNVGAQKAKGEFIFFLDDDNVVDSLAISDLVNVLMNSKTIGVATPVIYYLHSQNRIWTSRISRSRLPGFYRLETQPIKEIQETASFHDAFMMKKCVFEQVGGFDAVAFPMHFGELDFYCRMRKLGYRAVVSPGAKVWHDAHIDSSRSYFILRNRIILLKRHARPFDLYAYFLIMLPILMIYYSVHHMVNSLGNPFAVPYDLLHGIADGIAFKEASKRGPPLRVRAFKLPFPSTSLINSGPLVSVIIPTRNSERTLEACLRSLKAQTYPNLEILVVDNYSTDRTLDIAKASDGVKVYTKGSERSAQVNYGIQMARGKCIYRVDSDFVLEPRVIEEAVNACEVLGYDAVAVHNTSDPTISFWSKVRKLERDCYVDDSLNIAARFFKLRAFKLSGMFDESMIASEDYDMHNRLIRAGLKMGRIKSCEVHIGEPKTLREIVLKHIYYGKKIDEFIRKNPGIFWLQLSPIRAAYIRHWRDFLRYPQATLGFVLYQTVRYLAALIGYLSVKL